MCDSLLGDIATLDDLQLYSFAVEQIIIQNTNSTLPSLANKIYSPNRSLNLHARKSGKGNNKQGTLQHTK